MAGSVSSNAREDLDTSAEITSEEDQLTQEMV